MARPMMYVSEDTLARLEKLLEESASTMQAAAGLLRETLSVLKPFARYAARDEIKGLFPDFDAALDLYLKLGGKL